MQPLTTIPPNQHTLRARQDKKQENQQTAEKQERPPCTIRWKKTGKKHFAYLVENPEALGFHQETMKESRQQTEMTENFAKTSGLVLYQTLHYF